MFEGKCLCLFYVHVFVRTRYSYTKYVKRFLVLFVYAFFLRVLLKTFPPAFGTVFLYLPKQVESYKGDDDDDY